MSASKNIVVVGSCMMDFVSYAPRLPSPGETIHGRKFVTNFGGKGANQCVAASRLGGQTALVARVGDDIWGKTYKENLQKENVNADNVKLTENIHTGIAQIIVSDEGENQIVIAAGANNHLSINDVREAKSLIENASVVVLQLETSQEVAIETMKLCKGISILNGAPGISEYNENLLKLPTIFCVNETEASAFTGLNVDSVQDAEKAALNLLSKGCNSVLITLGAQGALYIENETKKFHKIQSPKVSCVDSTGAGDSFIGALAYLLANKRDQISIEKCIEIACFVAADSVTKHGTQISFAGVEILKSFDI